MSETNMNEELSKYQNSSKIPLNLRNLKSLNLFYEISHFQCFWKECSFVLVQLIQIHNSPLASTTF